jgi:hypothetical protein
LSDIDVAILLADGFSREEMWRLELELAGQVCELLESDQVDFFVLNIAPLVAQFEIISTGLVLLSNDETKRTDYEVAVMNRYWDFKRYDEEYDAHFVRRLKGTLDDAQRQEYAATLGEVRRLSDPTRETTGAIPGSVPE